ncbi:cell division regulator GpsB [Pontibacillus litoralis]|uniref:Cell division protein GpsB n=1 Tax=Pontibacillus litoralis JSM 072002 TaxID=1385512 RepID=A0A0A5G784_9BACI|nr:cell division regulator GpsB [Pontibacillus litoralis]KGX87924.1 cell division protein GpsB [Pontibacillus litoralis JSM 072002]
MGLDRIQVGSQEILDKEFKTGIRGYNQEEVDQFLDMIIQDYEVFYQEIDRLNQEIEKVKKQTSNNGRTRTAAPTGPMNYDVLQRLSNLEKAVFGKKYADS